MSQFMQRGHAAIQSRQLPEAEHWYRQAVAETPKDAQARACLGQTLCWLGRRDEGLAELRQAGQFLAKKAKKSRDVGLLIGLAEQLQFWNDWPGAADLLKQAVACNPAEVRGFQLLALAHSRLNQKKSALAAGRQAAKLAPESAMLQILLATLEFAEKLYEPARQRLEKVLEGRLTDEERFRAHKELATILDKLKQYPAVFPHLHAAADAAPRLPEVRKQDPNLVPDMLRAGKDRFDRELLGRWAGTEFSGPRAPVFVMGFMRSGTTLTQEVLNAHPDVFLADETDLVVAVVEELKRLTGPFGSVPERLRGLDRDGIQHLRDFYWARMRDRFGEIEQPVVVDKTTMNTIDIGFINVVFPDARVVFVLRDPRDVCLSCYMQTMIPTPSTVHLFTWQGTADFYAQVMDYWLTLRERLTLCFVEFRYEDAVSAFEETFRRVFETVGLTWDPKVAEFHRNAAGRYIASPSFSQVAQPLYTSSVARWKAYEKDFEPISKTLQPFVETFHYPPG